MDWLNAGHFEAIIVDCAVPECGELKLDAESLGVPVIPITTNRNDYTITGITGANVKAILTAVFKIAPLDRRPELISDGPKL